MGKTFANSIGRLDKGIALRLAQDLAYGFTEVYLLSRDLESGRYAFAYYIVPYFQLDNVPKRIERDYTDQKHGSWCRTFWKALFWLGRALSPFS